MTAIHENNYKQLQLIVPDNHQSKENDYWYRYWYINGCVGSGDGPVDMEFRVEHALSLLSRVMRYQYYS